jgi:hypothetical protein
MNGTKTSTRRLPGVYRLVAEMIALMLILAVALLQVAEPIA